MISRTKLPSTALVTLWELETEQIGNSCSVMVEGTLRKKCCW